MNRQTRARKNLFNIRRNPPSSLSDNGSPIRLSTPPPSSSIEVKNPLENPDYVDRAAIPDYGSPMRESTPSPPPHQASVDDKPVPPYLGEYIDNDFKDVEIVFFWVTHGSNVSSLNTFTEMTNFQFQSVLLYGQPYSIIADEMFENLLINPCNILLGSCSYLPTQHKTIYLPPLELTVIGTDQSNPVFNNTMGLWVFLIKKTGTYRDPQYHQLVDKCDIVGKPDDSHGFIDRIDRFRAYKTNHQIYSLNDMLQIFGDGQPILYSKIFEITGRLSKKWRIPRNKINVGIFSCQVPSYKVEDFVSRSIHDMVPRLIHKAKRANFVGQNQLLGLNDSNAFSMLKIPFNIPVGKTLNNVLTEWETILGIKTQGCAINVLAFFGIVPLKEAGGQVVCLPPGGTPSWYIVNEVNQYFSSRNPQMWDNRYIIVRYPLGLAVNMLSSAVLSPSPLSEAFIFKMLTVEYTDKNENARGHTVALAKFHEQQMIYLIDPQQPIFQPININEFTTNLVNILFSIYGSQFKSMDLFYKIQGYSQESGQLPVKTLTTLVQTNQVTIISPPTQTAGGTRRTHRRRSIRKKTKSTKSSKTRRRKRTNKRKTN